MMNDAPLKGSSDHFSWDKELSHKLLDFIKETILEVMQKTKDKKIEPLL